MTLVQNIKDRYLAYSHFTEFVKKHTPEIFSERQLRKVYSSRIEGMIANYIRLSSKSENCDTVRNENANLEKQEEAVTITPAEVRCIIINAGKETEIGKANLRIKVAYWIICYCPWLLNIIYPVYHPVRKLVFRYFRK